MQKAVISAPPTSVITLDELIRVCTATRDIIGHVILCHHHDRGTNVAYQLTKLLGDSAKFYMVNISDNTITYLNRDIKDTLQDYITTENFVVYYFPTTADYAKWLTQISFK